jgi:spore coat protein E
VHPETSADDTDWDVEDEDFEDLNPDFIVDGYEE